MKTRAIVFSLAMQALLGTSLLAGSAWGQSDAARPAAGASVASAIGKLMEVTGSVSLQHTSAVIVQANLPSGSGKAKAGDLVYQGDIVETGPDGSAGIVFGDGTTFNVYKNARMELNEFVYDPNGKSNSTVFNLSKGAFTFLAGKVAKTGSMKIETPVATMGIRGTAPHVQIADDGTVKFSTLVEEHGKAGQDASPRQGRDQTPARNPARERAERDLMKKINICRGC